MKKDFGCWCDFCVEELFTKQIDISLSSKTIKHVKSWYMEVLMKYNIWVNALLGHV